MDSFEQLRRRLSSEDDEFRRINSEHHACEARLALLAEKPALSTEEEFEEKKLKKRKLFLKDRMFDRIRSWETAQHT